MEKFVKAITQQNNIQDIYDRDQSYRFCMIFNDDSAWFCDDGDYDTCHYSPGEWMYPDEYTNLVWSKL